MIINVKVITGARKTEVLGIENNLFGNEILKVKISTPPVEGRANKELIRILSEYYKVSKNKVLIMKGEKSREKTVEIKK